MTVLVSPRSEENDASKGIKTRLYLMSLVILHGIVPTARHSIFKLLYGWLLVFGKYNEFKGPRKCRVAED